jgi:hypothetical protein
MQRLAQLPRWGRAQGVRFAAGGWIEDASGGGVQLVHEGVAIEQITITLLACWNPRWEASEISNVRFHFSGPILAQPRILIANGERVRLAIDGPDELALHADAVRHNQGVCAEVRHAGNTPAATASGEVTEANPHRWSVFAVAIAVLLAGGVLESLADLHLSWLAALVVVVPLLLLRINRRAEVEALTKHEPLGMFWLRGVPVHLRMRTDPEVQERFEKREARRAAPRNAGGENNPREDV